MMETGDLWLPAKHSIYNNTLFLINSIFVRFDDGTVTERFVVV